MNHLRLHIAVPHQPALNLPAETPEHDFLSHFSTCNYRLAGVRGRQHIYVYIDKPMIYVV
jgi:hypothetical protein